MKRCRRVSGILVSVVSIAAICGCSKTDLTGQFEVFKRAGQDDERIQGTIESNVPGTLESLEWVVTDGASRSPSVSLDILGREEGGSLMMRLRCHGQAERSGEDSSETFVVTSPTCLPSPAFDSSTPPQATGEYAACTYSGGALRATWTNFEEFRVGPFQLTATGTGETCQATGMPRTVRVTSASLRPRPGTF